MAVVVRRRIQARAMAGFLQQTFPENRETFVDLQTARFAQILLRAN